MATNVRASISKRSPYYISKHRYYELKHFCLQYDEWKKEYQNHIYLKAYLLSDMPGRSEIPDPVGEEGVRLYELKSKMSMVEETCKKTDKALSGYIFKAVTKGLSFVSLEADGIPCGKDMYYDRYRKFFYLLSTVRR